MLSADYPPVPHLRSFALNFFDVLREHFLEIILVPAIKALYYMVDGLSISGRLKIMLLRAGVA